jgi:hypothetical protein
MDKSDVAPGWTQLVEVGWPLLFRQPRGAMSEVFSALSFWEQNRVVVSRDILLQLLKAY